jgi:undecaprenyl pyrophosphate phosphatase UppP
MWCPLKESFLFPEQLFDYFEYALHLPTALILCTFFIHEWLWPFLHFKRCWFLVLKISSLTALSSIVTLSGYAILSMMPTVLLPLPIGFALTACALLSLRWCKEGYATWDISKAILLGLVQACAFMPGISRFGCTYVASRWMGISARRSFQISFLIQWPLIFLASVYSCFILHNQVMELLIMPFVLVMMSACVVAYIGLYLVSQMIKKKMMWCWAIYLLFPIMVCLITGVLHA